MSSIKKQTQIKKTLIDVLSMIKGLHALMLKLDIDIHEGVTEMRLAEYVLKQYVGAKK